MRQTEVCIDVYKRQEQHFLQRMEPYILAVILKMLRIPRVIVQSVQHFLKQSVKR